MAIKKILFFFLILITVMHQSLTAQIKIEIDNGYSLARASLKLHTRADNRDLAFSLALV